METDVVSSPTPEELLPGGIERRWKIADVMHYLGFGYTKTWRLIHEYELPCYQIGGDGTSPLRFDPDEVRAWAEQYKKVLKPRSSIN